MTVDQTKLVLNAFAAIFQNNLVSADLVSWKQYDQELNDRNGLNVSEQISPRYKVTQTTSGVQDLSSGVQDSVFGSEQFKVDQVFGASMGWDDFVKIRDIGDARESEALSGAATSMAEAIDAYVLQETVLKSNNWVGTPGNDLDDQDEFVSAYTRLKEEGVSDDNLRGVLNYSDRQKLSDFVVNLGGPGQEAETALREGFTGKISGIPTMFTQQLPALTTGSRAASGSSLVNGASQNVDYSNVAVSSGPGLYMTQDLNIDGLAASATVKAGDVFTIAGVNAFDNRKQASLGRNQQFVAVQDATMDSTGAGTIKIFPAIIVGGTGSGGDQDVNTAHATVDSAPADDAAITWLGAASTAFTPRAIMQKQAAIVNTAPLILPATGEADRKSLTRVPLTVRMWKNSDFGTGAHSVRFDVALTANIRDRRRICRVNGV